MQHPVHLVVDLFEWKCVAIGQTWTFPGLPGCCKYLQSPIERLAGDRMIIWREAIGNGTERSGINHPVSLLALNGTVILQTVIFFFFFLLIFHNDYH